MSGLADLLPSFGGLLSFGFNNWHWIASIVGAAGVGILVPGGPVVAFVAKNWKWLVPLFIGLVIVAAFGIDDGIQRVKVAHRDTTIAERDKAIANMQAEQQANIARAEAAVRKQMQADLDYSNGLLAKYAGEVAELQEKRSEAEISIASAPVVETPNGCPDPMSLPVMRAFVDGLPVDGGGAAPGDRKAGADQPRGAAGAQGKVPPPAR